MISADATIEEPRLTYRLIHPFKKIWHFVAVSLLFGIPFSYFFCDVCLDSLPKYLIGIFWSGLIFATQALGNSYVWHKLDEKVDWIEESAKRFILGVVFGVVYSLLAFFAVQVVMMSILNMDFPQDIWAWILQSSRFLLIITTSFTLLFSAIGFFNAWKESVLEKQHLESEMLIYKYESLRNQINPHFLFNSFNVLSALVYDDQQLAVKFIRQLSDLYRYVLESRDKEVVPLAEEKKFIESFIFLLKTRFESNLDISLDLETDEKEFIVPMSLQLLLENAVKHNEASKDRPLRIQVKRENGFVEVCNDLQVKNVGDESLGKGLYNLKQRYAFLSDKEVDVNSDSETFSVKLPILTNISSKNTLVK